MAEVSGRSLLATILLATLSSSVLAAFINNYVITNRNVQVDRQQNIALLLKINTSDLKDSPARAAAFAGMMLDQELVEGSFACTIIGSNMYTARVSGGDALDVINSVRNATSKANIDKYLRDQQCDVATLGMSGTEVAPDKVAPTQTLPCPAGILYTQFALGDQLPVARALQASINAAVRREAVTEPQVIANYDSPSVVVRYFFRDMEGEAKRWQDILDLAIGGTPDVKYAYISGYEQAIGSANEQTFELWWPKSMAVPSTEALKPVVCEKA